MPALKSVSQSGEPSRYSTGRTPRLLGQDRAGGRVAALPATTCRPRRPSRMGPPPRSCLSVLWMFGGFTKEARPPGRPWTLPPPRRRWLAAPRDADAGQGRPRWSSATRASCTKSSEPRWTEQLPSRRPVDVRRMEKSGRLGTSAPSCTAVSPRLRRLGRRPPPVNELLALTRGGASAAANRRVRQGRCPPRSPLRGVTRCPPS